MASLTITLDEEILEQARHKALEEGTSLDALLRNYLETYIGVQSLQAPQEDPVRTLLELSRVAKSGSGGRRWTRDELHER